MSSEMSLWVVQRWEPRESSVSRFDSRGGVWVDVLRPGFDSWSDPKDSFWRAEDAGHAFRKAVIENGEEKMASISYRVLPFAGATFNIALNVDAVEHEAKS